jgi:hypothetical protein
MRHVRAAALLVLAGSLPAWADDMPARKPGLWEVQTTFASGGRILTVRQCIDAETDRMMMSSTGPLAQAACPRQDVKRSGDTVTIDSTCSALVGKTATTHAVITGSLDSAYTMTVAAQGDAVPKGRMDMTVTGKWLGPCAADQKPGDMVINGHLKLNILQMQKHVQSQGIPLPK